MKDRSKPKTSTSNQYDKIFRENIEPIFLPLVEKFLGIIITNKKPLPDKIISTTEREMDSLYEVKTKEVGKFILHIEVQTKDDKNMVYRVSEYHALCLKKYNLPIKHIVIYLGKKPSKMRVDLQENEIFTGFELLSFNEMDPEQLLKSAIPEEVLLTILSDFKVEQSNTIIDAVLLRLQEICKNKNHLKKFTSQLTILSKLRNLEQQTVEKIKNMTHLFDIRTSILFQEGREEGREKGREEGKAEGKAEGRIEGFGDGLDQGDHKRLLIIVANMITKSPLDTAQIADLAETEEAFVIKIKENLEKEIWRLPDTWIEEEWKMYFIKREAENNIEN